MALSITPGVSPLSQREWLSKQTDDDGNPLAKFPSRGQFSAKAKAALAEAAAAGMTFSDPVKAPKAPKPEAKVETAGEKRARLMAELDSLDNTDEDTEPEGPSDADLAAIDAEQEVETVIVRGVEVEVREPVVLPVLLASEDGKPTDSPVGFDHCFRPGCFQTVEACQCKQGPKAPANLLTIS